MWGTSNRSSDALELHVNWGKLNQEVRNVEVVWSPVLRDTLGRLLLEQLQVSWAQEGCSHEADVMKKLGLSSTNASPRSTRRAKGSVAAPHRSGLHPVPAADMKSKHSSSGIQEGSRARDGSRQHRTRSKECIGGPGQ